MFGEMKKVDPEDIENFFNSMSIYVGTKNLQADAELCVLISDTLEKCGLRRQTIQ